MYITVEEALQLPALSEALLLAGEKGIDKKIRNINTMENPDVSHYIQEGSLLITTLYPIIDNRSMQETLVERLVEKQATALVIVPLALDKKIPDSITNQAKSFDFPLIKLPVGTVFNEISNPILNVIFKRKHIETEYRFKSSIIRGILDGRSTSKSQVLSLSRFYDWNLEDEFLPVVMLFDFKDHDRHLYYQDMMNISKKKGIRNLTLSEIEDGMVLLFPTEYTLETVKSVLVKYLETYLNATFGIGPLVTDIMSLKAAVTSAKQVAVISKKTGAFDRIVEFKNLGIYRLVFDSFDDEGIKKSLENKKVFIEEKLGAIIRYDEENNATLLDTLKAYFEENENIKNTAGRLFVHYNTMRHRLNKIEEVAGFSLDEPETQLELKMCFKIVELL